MKKISFVCHGNICRSPMAEFVFRKMLAEGGRLSEVEVNSRAVSREELGNPVYPPARAELLRHGIDPVGKCAVQITAGEYDEYDLIICMDDSNLKWLYRIFGGDPDGKVKKLMEYCGSGANVRDPWYTGDFGETYRDVYNGCRALYEELFGAD